MVNKNCKQQMVISFISEKSFLRYNPSQVPLSVNIKIQLFIGLTQ